LLRLITANYTQSIILDNRPSNLQNYEERKESSSSISFKVLQESIGDFSKKIYFDLKMWILIGLFSMITLVGAGILIWCLVRYNKCTNCFKRKVVNRNNNIELNENINRKSSSLDNNNFELNDNSSLTKGQLRLKDVLNSQGLQDMDNHFHDI
jgi:hypothetical protein